MSDTRTRQYTGGVVPETPVGIVIGDSIHTPAGRIALLAAANATVRSHPKVYVRTPDVTHDTGISMHETLGQISTATNGSSLEIVDTLPGDICTIGIGVDVAANVYIGAQRFTGTATSDPTSIGVEPSSGYGAGFGAMMASAVVFCRDLDLAVPTFAPLSLWTFTSAERATGPADIGPIDVGTGWVIGAGGVGSSFAWWLRNLGNATDWTFVDHDVVDTTNLNRSLGMFVHHLDRGDGTPWFKADAAADLVAGAVSFPHTWRDWANTDPSAPDVIIPAANEYGVRGALAAYGHPMALTGTTSLDWTAELHLYRSGLDGCIDCRHPNTNGPAFACSTGTVPTAEGGSTDAALSFLSGTAGLITVAALARLQAGEHFGSMNHWTIAFQPSSDLIVGDRYQCNGGVIHTPDAKVRASQFGKTRWVSTA